MRTIKNLFFYIIYGIEILSLTIMITVSVLAPRDNLFSWQMCIGVAAFVILLLLCFMIWEKIWERGNVRGFQGIYAAGLILFGFSLYYISCIGRNEPSSLVDYGIMWENALELARGGEIVSTDYFCTYANNIKPMLLLSLLFRAAFKLGWKDPFYFVLVLSVLQVLAAIWATAVLAKGERSEGKYCIPIVCFFVLCLPIWSNTQAFYTDTMSFSLAIVILAFVKLALQEERCAVRALFCLFAGMLTGLGIMIKITVCIPLIAAGIVLIFWRKGKCSLKKLLFYIFWGGLGCVVLYSGVTIWAQGYEITKTAKETSDPIIAWIALGLKGNGSYYDNQAFVYAMQKMSSTAEKTALCREYIFENRAYFWDGNHIFEKIRFNFASGHLGNTDYAYCAKYPNNIVWELFAPYGKYYWRTSQISFCYLLGLYVMYFAGSIASVIQYYKKQEVSALLMICDLTVLGYFLFLMIWEANNRQLYNQVPLLILGTVLHAQQIIKMIQKNRNLQNST